MRDGSWRRFGWASLLDVTNAALELAPIARAASTKRRLVFAGCNGTAAAVANSTCCSVINTGVRGDVGRLFDPLRRSAQWP